ncbi:hypothetical protein CP556_25010 [Natrinema sp. CBA1119]|uniref:hypothetical protein n=1 Tax=Natrinema sp. CBA1119 TaxID=1608465 RepID=UPI000BF75A55|nr:hypothetical protein [Natrinema sp. CBA1119]PGF14264.1 hypothetical protein CP556_25010 [Natrinema sp. CBA1119]
MNGRHAGTSDRPTYPEVKAEFGEDPARYLAVDQNDPHDDHPLALAHARIKDLDDLAHIKAWQRIEAENWGRREVMAHLDKRERELAGTEPIPEPETTPATATDGGTVTESNQSEPAPEPKGSDEPDDVHPDVRGLEAGQVLELERADGTEFIFPSQPAADEPFLCRSFDDEDDERTAEPIPLTLGEVASRPINDTDPVAVESIDKRAPTLAASNGADS